MLKISGLSPKVLVLMATYNGRQWIEEQVESVLTQNFVHISMVIQDDCSQDGTFEFLQNYYGNMENVDIRRNEIPSGSAGENFRKLYVECNLANFDYVALSDQDDIWCPNKINNAIIKLEANSAEGYSSAVEAFWPNEKKRIIQQSLRISEDDYLYEGCGQGCTYLIRVDLFQRIADFCRFNQELIQLLHYHDWLIYLLARVWGCPWVFDKNPQVKYRQHNNNEIGARRGITSLFSRLKLIKNGWFSNQINAAFFIAKTANPIVRPKTCEIMDKYKNIPYISKIILSYCIFKYGRRRFGDRIILIIATVFGWVKICKNNIY